LVGAMLRPVVFGEVLFDQFDDGHEVLGGAPFNVCWHLQAFGLNPLYISRIGTDALGEEIKQRMLGWNMDMAGLQEDANHPTGTVKVTIKDGQPVYDIKEKCAYDFIEIDQLPRLPKNGLLYHGTLALREKTSRKAFHFLKEKAKLPIFVDINLRDPWWTEEVAAEAVKTAYMLKLNDEELDLLTPRGGDENDKAAFLMEQGAAQTVVVTEGEKGACAWTADGERLTVAPAGEVRVADTVGAGDAFSSVLILGEAMGWPLKRTLPRAQKFANAIVGIRGATTEDRALYSHFIDSWELSGRPSKQS